MYRTLLASFWPFAFVEQLQVQLLPWAQQLARVNKPHGPRVLDGDHMELGGNYLFLTLSFYWTGRLVSMTPSDFVIEEAAQVFDLGELEHALKTGEVRVCQAVPDKIRVFVPRSGTTALTWPNKLPRTSKRD